MERKIKNLSSIINISLFLLLLLIIGCRVRITHAYAATAAWKGYAVYRDGAFLNINDHAAIMKQNQYTNEFPIIHAPGYGNVSKCDSWSNFLKGNNYIGTYRPYGCAIAGATGNSFASKARELRGISYNVVCQLNYSCSDDEEKVLPENILTIRCDGVVEYTYEWYNWRVGGEGYTWNITDNSDANFTQHCGLAVTPRKQWSDLLVQELSSQTLPN